MELPAIKLPQIELPFDIPVLLHPPVDHFIIALPIIVLLLEIVNLITKKRAIGVTAFFLLVLTVVAAIAAYFTGSIDGKEAFPLLSEAAQSELKEHKLLGTYLMLMSAIVLLFKLFSSMLNRGLMKGLYLLILILFVTGILKQGKDGGELVYEYGVNVQKVQELDSEMDDLKEELEELQEEGKKDEPIAKAEETVKEKIDTAKEKITDVVEPVKEKVQEVKSEAIEKIEATKKVVDENVEKIQEAATKIESDIKVISNTPTEEVKISTH